jgi:hypothetical protein
LAYQLIEGDRPVVEWRWCGGAPVSEGRWCRPLEHLHGVGVLEDLRTGQGGGVRGLPTVNYDDKK